MLAWLAAALAFGSPAAAQSPRQQAGAAEDAADIPAAPVFRLRGVATDLPASAIEDPFAGQTLLDEEEAAAAEAALAAEAAEPPVPPLADEPQARVLPEPREGPVTDPINTATPDPRAGVRAGAVEPGAPRRPDVDPFAVPGFRIGTFVANARLQQAIGYASNNTFSVGGKPGLFSQTDATFGMRSDWSRHEASVEASASLRRAVDTDQADIPEAGLAGALRLDLIDGFTSSLRASYAYSTEALTSSELTPSVTERPGVHRYGASGELARTGGRLDLSLRGSADRTLYEDAALDGGGRLSQADRDNTLYRMTMRLTYGTTPAMRPFVEGGVGWRLHDLEIDRNGNERDSFLYDLRAGLAVDLGEKLTGEMAVGYGAEDYRDPALRTLDGITVNGTLDWSPERDTNIRFTAATDFGGSTTAGESGSVDYLLALRAERRVRDNLAVNAVGSYTRSYPESGGSGEQSYLVGAGIEYWVSRFLSLTADVEYQNYDGGMTNRWDSTAIRLGVALQR